MNATELRILNYVEKGNEIFVADFLTIRMAYNYNPIPLTEEWLLKFGFIKKYSEFTLKGFNFIILNNAIFTNDDCITKPICNINYVHQLQNLFFVITCKELQITEIPEFPKDRIEHPSTF